MLFATAFTQNLVPNPSFEQFTTCPDNWAQIDRVDNWEGYKGSPDYFNSCGAVDSFSTPQNFMGNQVPYSGNSYAGLILYEKGGEALNEMIGAQLIQPLIIGVKYYVSLRVVLKYNNAFGICCGQDKIGVRFSNQSYSISNPPSTNNSAHIVSNTIISDTLNWIQIFGSFSADSSYSHITVGNFYNNINVSINDIVPANFSSYYFVDDICVSTDSSFCANYLYTGIDDVPIDNNISIYPNPATDHFTISSNIINEPYSLIIYNTIGQELYKEENVTTNNKKVNINNFNSNLLFIKIKTQNNSFTYKLLKP